MPRNTKENDQIRKLGKTGSEDSPSYFITLPKALIKELGWRDNQLLVVRRMHGQPKLIVEDYKEE
jgi:hypothetical protein